MAELDKAIGQRIAEAFLEHLRKCHGAKSVQDWMLASGLGALSEHGNAHHSPDFAQAALSNLIATAINETLVPGTDSAIDLGSTTKFWRAAYIDRLIAQKSTLTIDANDEITVPLTTFVYLTSAGATDNLDGIGAGVEGQIAFLTLTAGKDITLIHDGTVTAGKKLMLNGEANVTLDQDHDFAIAIYDATATVWNVLVPGAGGAGGIPTEIEDDDEDTGWRAEQAADEDKLRGRVGGTERYLMKNDASPYHTLIGNVYMVDQVGIGDAGAEFTAGLMLRVRKAAPANNRSGLVADLGAFSSTAAGIRGIAGNAAQGGSDTSSVVSGLDFLAVHASENALTTLRALYLRWGTIGAGAQTNAYSIYLNAPLIASAVPTTTYGIYCENMGWSGATTTYGIKVLDQTNSTNPYIAWLGGATPQLRVDGGAYNVAGKTALVLNVAGTLYRVLRNAADGVLKTEAA